MTGRRPNQRKRHDHPLERIPPRRNYYHDERGNGSFRSDSQRSPERDDYRHDRRSNLSFQPDHFDQQRLNLENELRDRITFLEDQNCDLISRLDALALDRDACLRKLDASDLASQQMAEELLKMTHGSGDAQEDRNSEELEQALEEIKRKDLQINQLKETNRSLEKKIDEKRNDVLHYKKKSDALKVRISELESEVAENHKKIDKLNYTIQARENRIQELISKIVQTPEAKQPVEAKQQVETKKPIEAKQSAEREMTFKRIKLEPPSDSDPQMPNVFNIANMTAMDIGLEGEQQRQEAQSNFGNEYPVRVKQEDDDMVDFSEIQPEEMVSFVQVGQKFAQLKKYSFSSSSNAFPLSNVPSTSNTFPASSMPSQFQQSSVAKNNSFFQSNVPTDPAHQSSFASTSPAHQPLFGTTVNPFTAPFSSRPANVRNFASNLGSSYPTQSNPPGGNPN